MKASFGYFMAGLIDYAGIFPPAGLDIETALRNFAGYLAGEYGWMLGRFVVPAARLHRVVAFPGFRCSVVVSPEVSQEEFDQLSAFTGRVETVETRLADSAGLPDQITDQLIHLKARLDLASLRDVQLFVETESATSAAAAIAAFNSRGGGEEVIRNVGYKLRCGGAAKKAFPTPEKVAEVITICREHDIPMKFTAGMHCPFRNYSAEIEAMQHGFINIFGAALLCWGCSLAIDETIQCLRDETPHHFQFAEEGFSWQDKTITASEVERLRRSTIISFGSCSFAEPVDGLRSQGFLGNAGA